MTKWISAEQLPEKNGDEYTYLITDGHEISIGYFEPEYYADDPTDELQYSSACWHDEANGLITDCCGWPVVMYWAELPELPKRGY